MTTFDAASDNCAENAGGDTTKFIMDENGGYDGEASDHAIWLLKPELWCTKRKVKPRLSQTY